MAQEIGKTGVTILVNMCECTIEHAKHSDTSVKHSDEPAKCSNAPVKRSDAGAKQNNQKFSDALF